MSLRANEDRSRRGFRGDIIPTHRALHRLHLDRAQIVGGGALALLILAGWMLVWPQVVQLWAAIAEFCFEVLGLPGQVSISSWDTGLGLLLQAPRFEVFAAAPGPGAWSVGLGITALTLLVSLFLPSHWLPVAYLLRLLAAVQVSSQIVFALTPTAFPYDAAGMSEVLLLANFFLIGLVPLIIGFAYFPLHFSLPQKLAAALLPMAHLTVFVPLQYVAHVWILHHASLLWMPILFWGFGLALDVSIVIALYGWAVSWKPRPFQPESRRRKAAVATSIALLMAAMFAPMASKAEIVRSIQTGLDLGRYSEDLGDLHGISVAYTEERPQVDRWRVDLGHASRFGDEGFGFGASYGFQLTKELQASAGMSAGTGDVIFPDWRFDAGLRRTGLAGGRLLADLGYTHVQSKAENSSDGVGAGLLLAATEHWSIGMDGRVDIGQPGSTVGYTIAASVQYGIYRELYASLRAETGRIAYTLVGPSDALVEFDSQGARAGLTWYLKPDRGLALEASWLDTEFYDLRSIGLRAFREW